MEIVKSLIEHGADVNATTENGETPLLEAVRKGELLSTFNIKHKHKHNFDIRLCSSLIIGHMEIIKFLFEKGAKVNAQTKTGEKAFLEAVMSGNTLDIKLLFFQFINLIETNRFEFIVVDFNGLV